MLRRDLNLYRTLLVELSLGDLAALYERTVMDYPHLARAICEELDCRMTGPGVGKR